MAISERSPKERVGKIIRRNVLPAITALLALSLASGCIRPESSEITRIGDGGIIRSQSIEFPKCEIDSQPYSVIEGMRTGLRPLGRKDIAIEGLIFRPFKNNPQEVEIEFRTQNPIITFYAENHTKFKGNISGRNIDIKFSPPERDESGSVIEIKASINTTCDSKTK